MPSGAMALRPLRCVRPLKALSSLGRAARPISVEAMQLNAPLKVTGSWVGFAERNQGETRGRFMRNLLLAFIIMDFPCGLLPQHVGNK